MQKKETETEGETDRQIEREREQEGVTDKHTETCRPPLGKEAANWNWTI